MSGPTFRIAAWTAAVAALAGTLWLAFRPAPVPCDLGAAGRGPLTVTIDEDGRTRLKERYVVSSPLAGRVDRIALKAGDTVEAGATVLARIAPPNPALLDERARAQAQARVRSAEAALARAEPELARCRTEVEHLQGELRRVTEAAATGAASQKDLEDQRLMLRSAELARDTAVFAQRIAAFELEQARAALLQHAADPVAAPAGFEVRSPISGRVLRVVRESAGILNPGDPLLEIGAPADLEIELDVLSDQAVRVRPGQRVAIERWGGDRPLSGVVRLVEPSGFMKVSALGVEEQRVNVIVDLLDPPAERAALGDNYRVEARIEVWSSPDVLRVPVGALFRSGDRWAVYAVESGRARLRPVEIGRRSALWAEVLSGLGPGDPVVLYPGDRVADGVRIRPR